LGKIIETLNRSKSIEILFELEKRRLKFNEIVRIAGNSTTAMRRTQELHNAGLVGRKVLQDRQRSVEYSLTKKGKETIPLIKELLKLEK
jgi:DNA-binding HxlR family transcriptional regulator